MFRGRSLPLNRRLRPDNFSSSLEQLSSAVRRGVANHYDITKMTLAFIASLPYSVSRICRFLSISTGRGSCLSPLFTVRTLLDNPRVTN